MSTITIRPIQIRSAYMRPAVMPSVRCPIVRDLSTGRTGTEWMGINHCNACAYVRELHINYETGTGEVHCAA
ncbi:hypothetical protein [Mariprofundus ferrooxydans]|uniref:Uncharacterized protein n=1 Tax=Mariprofundus ferrooxydans PV-1 TaxID=314345 RepID=Q0EWC0_9PROT|nr:hypothetical protein [Mariprofundus ferrooxydans]EAU53551.1 hypothetical protein SPV1_02898 [Mariprofundus ferrooxydans PV-1]KON47001.1 hypothetical protein AL013_10435 [Mariprofundus ferrooxydans]